MCLSIRRSCLPYDNEIFLGFSGSFGGTFAFVQGYIICRYRNGAFLFDISDVASGVWLLIKVIIAEIAKSCSCWFRIKTSAVKFKTTGIAASWSDGGRKLVPRSIYAARKNSKPLI